MFNTILISSTTFLQLYVLWRAATVPFIKRHVPLNALVTGAAVLWLIFLLGRTVGHNGSGAAAATLELLGMSWMACLLLFSVPLLAVDLITCFGLLMPRLSPRLRGVALLAGLVFSVIAVIQGVRPPVVDRYEVRLPDLPRTLDGTVIVGISDMHLGSLIGAKWLEARIAQVNALRPDLVVLLGDIFEGHDPPEDGLIAAFRQLSAPLGVWAVPGNHEFHSGEKLRLFDEAGMTLLFNKRVEPAPGLVVAGVEDLLTRLRRRLTGDPVTETLQGIPPGKAVILLSHTPLYPGRAARAGAGLMLCGHTHGGQIWPLGYLVRRWFPQLAGRYVVDGMTVIVSRGAGTWGMRMRLWQPGQILYITLRSPEPKQ